MHGDLTQSEIPKIPNRYRDILQTDNKYRTDLKKYWTVYRKNRYRLEIPTPTLGFRPQN